MAPQFLGWQKALEERSSPYAALFLRFALGSLFIAHLYWKFEILPGGVERWWSGFKTSGYPWFVPWYVISAEFVGAGLLIPGIYTRWACLYVLPLMIGATEFWWVRKGFYFTSAGCELPLLWACALLVQTLLGDGAFAVMPGARRRRSKAAPQPSNIRFERSRVEASVSQAGNR